LLFVPHEYFLSAEEEKSRYDQHKNSPTDKRYRHFLNSIFSPIQERLAPKSCGMDFGSGPGPTMSVMFEEVGHSVVNYDPFYAKQEELLKNKYDFITATEVVEHLHDPIKELDMLWGMLKPGGWLGIMTNLAFDSVSFKQWYYKDDPTHVCFFSPRTFEWLAAQWNTDVAYSKKNVILFRK